MKSDNNLKQFKSDMFKALIKGNLTYEDIAMQFVIGGYNESQFNAFVYESKLLINKGLELNGKKPMFTI